MKSLFLRIALLVSLVLACAQAQALDRGRAPHGELKIANDVFVLRVWGTPHERGVSHGMLVAKDFMETVKEVFKSGMISRARYENRILPLVKSSFEWPGHVMDEIRGIYEGIDLVLDDGEMRIDALDRNLMLDDMLAINTLGDWGSFACSTVSVWGSASKDGHTIVGRNFDFILPLKLIQSQFVLAEEACDGRFAFHTVAFPGTVGGITCFSEKGVFASVHDVHVMPKEPPKGCTPRLTVLRMIAEKALPRTAVQDALEICRERKTIYGNNFHVAAPAFEGGGPRAGVLEYDSNESADQGATLRLPENADRMICTNHYRARSKPFGQCPRYRALDEACNLLCAHLVKIDLESMKTLIAESEVKFTMHQVVADLDEKTVCIALQKRLMVPASNSGFRTLRWDEVFPGTRGK